MTRDDIIRMAREAGLSGLKEGGLMENFERFANLVAADAYTKGWQDAMFRKSLEEK
jgi:hypothetical protein